MTTVEETDVGTVGEPSRRRRTRRVWLAVPMLVAVVVGVGVWGLVYVHTYQPLGQGDTVGPLRSIGVIGDGTTDTQFVLRGPPGTSGVLDYTVANSGPHPVRLLGLDRAQHSLGVTGLRWVDRSGDNPGNGVELGTIRRSHRFPVTLPAGQEVFIQVYLHKPSCSERPNLQLNALPIRWEAFGVHHVWWDDLAQAGESPIPIPVDLCPTGSALAHLER